MFQPYLIQYTYSYVFILLDDILLSSDFDLLHFISIMKRNNLTTASPRIVNANIGGGQKFRLIMQKPPISSTFIGYYTSYLELFAVIYTIPTYQLLWNLLCPSINPYGWGYDLWYACYAKKSLIYYSIGIINKYTAHHIQNISINGVNRADNTSFKVKWKAVLEQEKHYALHYKVLLRKCRVRMKLRSGDWDGAVLGVLS